MVKDTFALYEASELASTPHEKEYAVSLINYIADRLHLDEQGFLVWLNTPNPALQMKPRDAVKTYGLSALERIMYAHKAPIASLRGPNQLARICKFLGLPAELAWHHGAIHDGFDIATIAHLANTTNLTHDEILELSGIDPAAVENHRHNGTRLTAHESNRLYHTAAALAAVYALHPNPVDVPNWLRHAQLPEDTTPMHYLTTDAGVMWLIRHMTRKFRPDIP